MTSHFMKFANLWWKRLEEQEIHLPKVAPAGTHNRSYTSFAFHLPPLCFQLLQKEAQGKGGDMIEQGVEMKRELNHIFDTLWGDHTLAPCNEGKCNLHQS